jgi:hypothetical protein
VESAGAPTAVVTPPGDTPTSPGGAVGGIPGSPTDDVDGAAGGDVGGGSVVDEHPDSVTNPAATALTARSGYLRMPVNLCNTC